MSRDFRFPSHRLAELVRAPKAPTVEVKWKPRGASGSELRLRLDLVDGPYAEFELHVTCGNTADVRSYRAALILEGERVRGVDFSEVARMRFYRVHIERGWHENVIDPNLPLSDRNQNRHLPLPDFAPNDLASFLREICELWHIDLDFDEALI